MKKQTYMTILEDENGQEIDFERWAYKRAQTCISKMLELYSGEWAFLYRKEIDRAARIVCYPTPDGYNLGPAVWSATVAELKDMIQARQKKTPA